MLSIVISSSIASKSPRSVALRSSKEREIFYQKRNKVLFMDDIINYLSVHCYICHE